MRYLKERKKKSGWWESDFFVGVCVEEGKLHERRKEAHLAADSFEFLGEGDVDLGLGSVHGRENEEAWHHSEELGHHWVHVPPQVRLDQARVHGVHADVPHALRLEASVELVRENQVPKLGVAVTC